MKLCTPLMRHSSGIVKPEEFGVEFEVNTVGTSTSTAGVLKFLSEYLAMDMAKEGRTGGFFVLF